MRYEFSARANYNIKPYVPHPPATIIVATAPTIPFVVGKSQAENQVQHAAQSKSLTYGLDPFEIPIFKRVVSLSRLSCNVGF